MPAEPMPVEPPQTATDTAAPARTAWASELRGRLGGYERRGAARHAIETPVRWSTGGGRTCNMSASGVLFETNAVLVPGERLKLAVIGDAPRAGDKRTYALCDVLVLRVDRENANDENYKVAVAIKSMRVH